MADMETQEFKFPDELEGGAKPGDTPVENAFSIEIEDDTPEEDRGRTPSNPEKVKQLEIDVDDLDKYSKDAKDKIIKMKRVWNDERREKEAALREQQAAIEAAQYLMAENQRMKDMLNKGAKDYKEAMGDAAKLKYKAAKKAFKAAHESGDTEALMAAQESMLKAQRQMDEAKKFKLPPLQQEQVSVQRTQQVQSVPQPDARVMRWQQENPWFGQDQEMTASALGLHEKMRSEGVHVGSEEYYARLDATMRKRFGENFSDAEPQESTAPPTADKPKAKPVTNVAPATRTTAPKKVRLSQSQVAIAKKLGLTPEQYVRELLKMEA
jgi:hypothetical protein